MKKVLSPIALLATFYIALVLFLGNTQLPNAEITSRQKGRFESFLKAVQQLESKTKTLENTVSSKKEVQTAYLNVRKAFKEWEYLAEHLDYLFIKDYINGAPLPKLERESFGLNIQEPKGLQVIDELVFSDSLFFQKENILKEIVGLKENLNKHIPASKIYDQSIFEAARTELVRIFALGETGFDTPASGNALADAHTSVIVLQTDMSLYFSAIKSKNPKLAESLANDFESAKQYLAANQDFDTFDRLTFLKKYIDPLYGNLLLAQETLEIEMPEETGKNTLPINYKARSIFANDFLDPVKYMRIPSRFVNKKTIELGKTLFFDPALSASNERSCASCHNPAKGFTDNLSKSTATGRTGSLARNSPTLLNCVYSERFFHDLRAKSLEEQTEHVITSAGEFNTTMLQIIEKLKGSVEYQDAFKNAFPEYTQNSLNSQTIQYAISSYVSSLSALNSPFDKYVRGETKQIPTNIKNGFNLFMGKAACGACHFAPTFNGTVPPLYLESESEVLGVPENPYTKPLKLDPDRGRAVGTMREGTPFYEYSFKTPTVRNVSLSAPYMHNGAYKTLEDVMDFYNNGGGKGMGLTVPYQTLSEDSLHLNKQETNDIIAFMQSLTDTTGLTSVPKRLPVFEGNEMLNKRKIGGEY